MRPWQSLRRTLPLLISALLCLVVVAVCTVAYHKVEAAFVQAAGSRLTGVTQQLAALLDESARRLRRDVRQLAADPALVAFLTRPSSATRGAAEHTLMRARGPQAIAVALWSPHRELLLSAGPLPRSLDGVDVTPVGTTGASAPGGAAIGRLVRADSGLLFQVVAPVLAPAPATGRMPVRDTVGFLVSYRRLASGQGAERIAGLIDARAALLVGNATGGVWTDLSRTVAGPPGTLPLGTPTEYVEASGQRVLTVALPIQSTPWLVAVQLPRDAAFGAGPRFVLDMAGIALTFVALGAGAAWILSRRVTAPLIELTRAAEDVARGNYGRRVSIARRDELGSLAASFNSMAEQVEVTAHALSARARDLETANRGLTESEERYRRLVEAAHEGICTVDASGTITYANVRLGAMLGYAPETLVGRLLFDLLEPDAAFEARTRFARRQRGMSEVSEVPWRRHDGTTLWVAESVSSLIDAEGRFTGALFMLSDVTERFQARERLERSERHFRALIENSSDMLTVLDGNLGTRYASPAFEAHTGYSTADVSGTPSSDRIHPDDLAAVRAALTRAVADPRRPVVIEYRFRHKDGRWLALSSVATSLVAEPDVRGIVMNTRDVTEQRGVEAQLRQAQKMEAVGQLAGGVAHDFNNLLAVMTTYAGMLLADLPADDPTRADLEEIRRAAERAAGLTRQLLAFSRQQVLQPRVLDLNAVVYDLERMLGRVLREDVRLVTALAPQLGRVNADPGQLEQVIVNLAVNARDAMPDGGALTIETADVELDEDYARLHPEVTPGPYVMLAVSDTGCGMDAPTLARAFEPFFTTKEVGKGTGLGLSTVYGIVKQSGGHVGVYSEPGIGTTVKVYLPGVQGSAVPRPRSGSYPALHRGTGTILLVEDDGQVRTAARRILERAGYTVLEAASGPEALQLCSEDGEREPKITLLVTDLVMPGMSGRELADEIRARYPAVGTAYMSGYTADAVLRQGDFEPGAVFIQKPFTPQTLTEKLREALEGMAARG